jgi:DNA-binding Lrp family transcriptional regulator
MSKKIDLYDKKILFYLDIDSRMTASALSKKIKLPKESVNYRIKRLLRNDIIIYFNTIINASLFCNQYYHVYLKLYKHTKADEKRIINFLMKNANCSNLRVNEGRFDIVFMAILKDSRKFRELMSRIGNDFKELIFEKSINIITRSIKLNQKLLYSEGDDRKVMHHDIKVDGKLDNTDIRILRRLSNHARESLTGIARRLKLDPKVVRYRMKKLQKQGVIAGYSTVIDYENFGFQFVQLDFVLQDMLKAANIIEFFNSTNTCLYAYETIGKYDLSIQIYVNDDEHLRVILDRFKSNYRDDYITYDMSRIFKNFITNWSPFRTGSEIIHKDIEWQE